jgi:haloacetate dehalogenase
MEIKLTSHPDRRTAEVPLPNIARYFTAEAVEEYIRCFLLPGTIHANCEDYRASAGVDLDLDAEDQRNGREIQAPVLAPGRTRPRREAL